MSAFPMHREEISRHAPPENIFEVSATIASIEFTKSQLNVWEESLPEFDSEAIGAKYKGVAKEAMSEAESGIWWRIQSLAARFQAADLIVFGVPMWNFAYPYKLKQLIDLVCQRNLLFTFSEGKFGPLLKTRNAVVIYSRGQTYAEHSPTPASLFDHQKGYIDFWLHFIGVEETHSIVIENTWGDREAETLAKGKSEAIRLVEQL